MEILEMAKRRKNPPGSYIMIETTNDPELREMAEAIRDDDHRRRPDSRATLTWSVKALIREEFHRRGLRLKKGTKP